MESLRLDRRSAVEQVADGLRDRMFDGTLPPGTRLRELDLADSLQVARSTVREALLVLRKDRLVVRRDNGRGWEVRRLRPDEITDIFRARRWIEFAAVSAAEESTGDPLGPVEKRVAALADAMRTEDKPSILAADLQCHLELVRMTGSERLVGMYAELLRDLRPLLAVVEQPSDWPRELKNHRKFVRLMRRGEWDAARASMVERLTYVEETMIANIESSTA
ncbi:MAG: FCD domain-containing protein [Streptosporangiales bacterium]|nr:FCD domain-containing protein [Streptosporangiales bacterium]